MRVKQPLFPDGEDEGTATDGPWRVAGACIVCLTITSAETRTDVADLASRLRQAGFPLSDMVVAGPSQGPSSELRAVLLDAAARGLDVLILGDDVEIEPEAAETLRRVASGDPMIAGASPRIHGDRPHRKADGWPMMLPAVTYVPLPDPRCLYVKGSVLSQFAPDRLATSADWDAYALTINAVGFRMALANHAGATSRRPVHPDDDLPRRALRLEAAYPGTKAAVRSFLSSAPSDAVRMLQALEPDASGRRRVCFDLTHIGTKRSGTGEVALALIRRALRDWTTGWTVCVLASLATHAVHFDGMPDGPRRIDPEDPEACAAFIRIGQPFSWKEIDAAIRRAPTLIFFMLDTIGLDCLRLAPDELDPLWRFTLAEADGLLFNSAFTARQYQRRFGAAAHQPRRVSLHSLDTSEYAPSRPTAQSGDAILIIGNAFPHKGVEPAARLLARAFPERSIVALGLASGTVDGVTCHASGGLDDDALAKLYGQAAVVVYPSFYEGFGLPLLEALAHRRPVLARDLPPFAEIAAALPDPANIHLFHTDEELVALVREMPVWTEPDRNGQVRGWDDSLHDLRQVLDEALASVTYDKVLRRIDFLRGRLAFARQKSFDDPVFTEKLDRMAGLAGRTAYKTVYDTAKLWGIRALLRRIAAKGPRGGG